MQATRELGGANSTVIPILIRDPEMLIEAMLEAKAEVDLARPGPTWRI